MARRDQTRKQAIPILLHSVSRVIAQEVPCVFLDSARVHRGADLSSYLFIRPVQQVVAHDVESVLTTLETIDTLSRDYWVAGFVCYEAFSALRLFGSLPAAVRMSPLPLVWFGVFEEPFIFDHSTGSWNKALPLHNSTPHETSAPATMLNCTLQTVDTISSDHYRTCIEAIREQIRQGNTYQVNYTYDVSVSTQASSFELYTHLRQMQRTPYCAYIQNEYGEVMSFSPELFFKQNRRSILLKPMKGTLPRGLSAAADETAKAFLAADEKNRAENLMIVDLIRNDIGRLCIKGGVRVPKLFEIETHPTVHQMTSTVTGTMRKNIRFSDIVAALFPCGSVTGAPKISTMSIINRLESGSRGVYCGMIGYTSPQKRAVFSVPIRILQRPRGAVDWQYRVGGGIIWDSTAQQEWAECHDKYAFLKRSRPQFSLVETIAYRGGAFRFLQNHRKRMAASARYFDFPFSSPDFATICSASIADCNKTCQYRIRILLQQDGSFSFERVLLSKEACLRFPVTFELREADKCDPFLFHKTTFRPWYQKAVPQECFDIIFCDTEGRICEGGRSTIFMRKEGILFTPSLEMGILPGILRSHLIKKGMARECILTRKDLYGAEAVFCGNSVRGLVAVELP
ncbi:MAG: aminodeoxychorismate synthase component I [Chitinivibrionales bacterium]|nr:aminodeoxychorismate synthase component I [Chitinivibrionales bacterium]